MTARVRLIRLALVIVVFAQSDAVIATADVRAVLSLMVNQAAAGESLVILRDGDALVPVRVLESAGVKRFEGRRETLDGQEFVSLQSLTGVATFELDEAALELRVQASADSYGRRRLDLSSLEPSGTVHTRNTSAFFNYAASWSRRGAPTASGELGIHTGGALFTTTVTRTATGAIERGMTTATIDQAAAMRRLSFGDTTIHGGPLAGSAIIAGFGISREFSLNPYFVRFPTPHLTETITTPSTVDVYVNDRLVRRAELAPGTIDVTGIPALNGPGQTRLVIRDAFGRSTEIANSYYITTSVLTRGLQDYQYGIGFRRTANLRSGPQYGEPMFSASHRLGLTDSMTVGFRSDGSRRLVRGGPTLTARVGRIGQLELAGSLSRGEAGNGAAGSAAWTYLGRRFSAGASVRAFGAGYVSVGDPIANGTRRRDLTMFTSIPAGVLGTLSLQHQDQDVPMATIAGSAPARNRRTAITGSSRIVSRAQVLWSAARVSGASIGLEAYAGVSIGLGSRGTVMAAANRRSSETSTSVELQKPLDIGDGIGYRIRADTSADQGEVNVQYQNRHGRYELRQDTNQGALNTSVNVSGGIVMIGNTITFSRPVHQSFALVRVPGVEGVRVLSSNLEVGRTNKRGDLLLPALLPNYSNRLAIADQDIPVDRSVPDGERRVAPPWRGGAVVTFSSARLQAASGRIDIQPVTGSRVTPAFGLISVTVNGMRVESPISDDGTFFFEQLPPGEYQATIAYLGVPCVFNLHVPALTRGYLADLGPLTCEQR